MKKAILLVVLCLVFLLIGLFIFFYYIKPQREYIKINTQSCINKAMSPINSETAKYYPNPYRTSEGFKEMLKVQDVEMKKCMSNYDTILFSPSEKNLVELSLNSNLEKQASDINSYTKRVEGRMAEQKQSEAKQTACRDRETVFNKYENCMEDKKNNDPNYWNTIDSFILDDSKNPCLKQYNYKIIDVDSFVCMMMGIITP